MHTPDNTPAAPPATGRLALWPLLKDLYAEVQADRVGLTAAGIAYYGLLSLFPGLAAMMALGGLLTRPQVLVDQLQQAGSLLPPQAREVILAQATEIAGSQKGGLGLTALIGIVTAIWSASAAVRALITGIHIAAGRAETRGTFASLVFTLGMTMLGLVLALVAILSTLVLPAILAALPQSGTLTWILGLVRWPVVAALVAGGLALFYRQAIRERRPPPAWVTPGAITGAVLWLLGSVAFSIYVQNFANYNETFGTLGGVVSLLVWMWLSAFIVLLGEEINSLLESRKRGG